MAHPHAPHPLPQTAADREPTQPARRRCLKQGIGTAALIGLSWATPACADWADDVTTITKYATRGNFLAAEEFATQSLNRGPGGLLFAGTGTLIIHHWRGRLRLLGGDTQGAIADADKIIQADSSFLSPDAGYALRAMAKAVARDASGCEADFQQAMDLASKASYARFRVFGAKGERATARLLLNDFAGALQDLDEAIDGDHDTRMMATQVQIKKTAWTHLRQAIPSLETGDLAQASIPIRAAVDVLQQASAQHLGSDFLTPQLLLMQIELWEAERQATQAAPATAP
ncbi:MAG: hypothetical protein RBT42_09140 [Aquabacterium sp.]|jgi:tetratricopeptide (TPR) repeat protein|uniref:hypothetical protein n=1 Tax=Aquabacterium sp. TaxID=1872578 RepID=UPI002A35C5DC|nr:hypothetical protein [Aquabacterium sp.]MDX9843907.1 hypothetical protein [Aquabacterium sp.]